MLKQLHKRRGDQKGFTIIEVLIVLAIAGLILLIVFLAVPALQRNARNTSRRDDISRVLGAAQEVINNGNGQMSSLTTTSLQTAVGTLGYYDSSKVTVAAAPASPASSSDTDSATVYTGSTCDTDSSGKQVVKKGTSRQLAILFAVESGTSTISQCTAS